MKNVKLETNVLIIGKSGVGKSSLLNYIFAKELAATRTGKPVTKEDIFQESLVLDNNLIVNVYDTWGLEADKTERWKMLILNEIQKHNCLSVSDWFHSIFYCFSAKSARIEYFEKEILKGLINEGNKVIVILTHSDVNVSDKTFNAMISELNEIGIDNENIIKVCSIGKKLLSGKTTNTFGREDVINRISSNLWTTIYTKLPGILYKLIDENINEWYKVSCNYVDKEITFYNVVSKNKLEDISSHINNTLQDTTQSIIKKIKNNVTESVAYFMELNKCFDGIMLKQDVDDLHSKHKFRVSLVIKNRIDNALAILRIILLPTLPLCIFNPVNIFVFTPVFKEKEKRKNEIKVKLLESKEFISSELKKDVASSMEYLESLTIDIKK